MEFTFELAKTGTLSLVNYSDLPTFESQEQLWDFEENELGEIAEEIILQAHDFLSDLGYESEEIFGLEYGWFQKMRNKQIIIVETSIQGRSPPPENEEETISLSLGVCGCTSFPEEKLMEGMEIAVSNYWNGNCVICNSFPLTFKSFIKVKALFIANEEGACGDTSCNRNQDGGCPHFTIYKVVKILEIEDY